MKKALVTGAAGFLGSHLCDRLLKEGYAVVGVDCLFCCDVRNLDEAKKSANFTCLKGDVRELPTVLAQAGIEANFDEIYSLACPASPIHYQKDPLFTLETSVLGIRHCLNLARTCGAKLLHASTSEIYGDPLVHPQVETYWGNVNTIGIRSCYDEGKRVAETYVADSIRQYGVDARLVRIFNTYGPRMHANDGRVVSNFIVQALKNEDLTIYGDGAQTRSFQYVDDLIEAWRRYMSLEKAEIASWVAREGLGAPVINTGNPGEFTIAELAQEVLAQVTESTSMLVRKSLPGDDPKKRRPDITRAKALLGWEPKVPLKEGLARTIAYFRATLASEQA